MAQNKNNKKKAPSGFTKYKTLWKVFAGIWVAIFLFFTMLSLGWLGFMPSFDDLENPNSSHASEVISSDGEILGFFGLENRSDVSFDEIDSNLVNALLATEDIRFYDHSGIDLRSLGRVLIKTIVGRNSSSGGGSTITQQLAKNLFPREKKSRIGLIYSKFKEWIVAAKLEHTYSKDEIIALYLNTVDFGSGAFGIKTAAKTFFDKDPNELKIEESAMLVGMLKAPTAYSPVNNIERATERRNTVLSQMAKYEYITEEQCDSLQKLTVDVTRYTPQTHNDGLATHFREKVREFLKEWCKDHKKDDGSDYDIYKDGLRVYTTIDSRLQRYAEEAMEEHMGGEIQPAFFKELGRRNNRCPFVGISQAQIDGYLTRAMKSSDRYQNMKDEGFSEKEILKVFKTKTNMKVFSWRNRKHLIDTVMSPWDSLMYYKSFLNVGLMSVEPGTGFVRVYIGGIDYRYFKYDNVKSNRQVGSTFKPFVYTAAMMHGITPNDTVPNSEVCFETPDGDWCPKNSNNSRVDEMVTLRWALANSVNYVSAYLMKNYTTPDEVIGLVRKMGIQSSIPAVPSICLGTADLSVEEMAGAMATYPNNGEYVKPIFITRIEDRKGKVLATFKQNTPHSAMSPQIASCALDLMRGVVDGGTGGRLRYKYGLQGPLAGKTGTTQNNSDAWFIGITPHLVTAVWVGGEIRSIHSNSMALGQGASAALPIFGLFWKKVYNDPKLEHYKGGGFAAPVIDMSVNDDFGPMGGESDDYEYNF